MWDFQLLKATQAIERSMAVALYRFAICLGIAFAFMAATLAGAGTGFAVGSLASSLSGFGHVGGLLGFIACAAVMLWMRGRLLFSVRCPQIAAAVEYLAGRPLPVGTKQIAAARQLVEARFESVARLTELDRAIRTTLADLLRALPVVSRWLSSIQHPLTARVVNTVAALPMTWSDAAILAYQLREKDQNLWQAGQRALVVFAGHFDTLLKNALILVALSTAGLIAVFFLMLEPVGWVEALLPESIGWWRYVFALVLAWVIAAAFFKPIAEIAMVQLFFASIEGEEPSSEWDERLRRLSPSYSEICKRAPAEANAIPGASSLDDSMSE